MKIHRLLLAAVFLLNSCAHLDSRDVHDGTHAADEAVFKKKDHWNPDRAPRLKNEEVQRYLQTLLKELDPTGAYLLTITDEDRVNGAADVGGDIYVTRGMLYACVNEAELAGYLAHEIGHHRLHHVGLHGDERGAVAKMIDRAALEVRQRTLSGIAGTGANEVHDQIRDARDIGYGRKKEQDADEFGARLIAERGYNPYALADLFDRLSSLVNKTPLYHIAKIKGSHKRLDARATHLRQFLKKKGLAPEGELGEDRYRAALDSLIPDSSAARSEQEKRVLSELAAFEKEIQSYRKEHQEIPLDRFMDIMERLSELSRENATPAAASPGSSSDPAFMEEAISLLQPLWGRVEGVVGQKIASLIEQIGQIGVSLIPVVGEVMDAYELFSGKDFYTGESLSPGLRTLTAIGLLSGVASGKAVREGAERIGRGIKDLLKGSKISRAEAEAIEKSLRQAIPEAEKVVGSTTRWKQIPAAEVNQPWIQGSKIPQPPWKSATQVYETTTTKPVRLYQAGIEGSQAGKWAVFDNPSGKMTKAQYKDMISHPANASDLNVLREIEIPSGTRVQVGYAGKNEWGEGGGVQWHITDSQSITVIREVPWE